MSKIAMEIGHNLSHGEAISRLERLLVAKDAEGSLLRKIDVTREDEQFSFSGKVRGFNVSGEVVVLDSRVQILVNLPWAARPFRELTDKHIFELIQANLR